MTIQFRPAVRERVGLIIGMIGPTGSGKTYSALELATGLAGGKRFAVIDTEAGRARDYADQFAFDVADLAPPFRPSRYQNAIEAAEKTGYPAIVVDSMSHEHAGDGGLLDWHEEELQRMAGDNYAKRESCKFAAWIKPKMAHKAWVQRLLQVRSHLILCFRAEEKARMERDDKGKMQIVPIGWQPVCEKNLPYELTLSVLFSPDAPGVPQPLKLQAQHRPMVPLDKPITRAVGARLGEWAEGAKAAKSTASSSIVDELRAATTPQQLDEIAKRIPDAGLTPQQLDEARAIYSDLRDVLRAGV